MVPLPAISSERTSCAPSAAATFSRLVAAVWALATDGNTETTERNAMTSAASVLGMMALPDPRVDADATASDSRPSRNLVQRRLRPGDATNVLGDHLRAGLHHPLRPAGEMGRHHHLRRLRDPPS